MPAIEILLEHDTAGDAISGLRWTRQTPHKMAHLLEQTGIAVWANTVARLLHQMNYSSASPTTRPAWPLLPSPHGGAGREWSVTPAPLNC